MKLAMQITDCARKLLLRLSTSRPSMVSLNVNVSGANASSHDLTMETDPDTEADWPYQFLERLCSWQEVVQVSREFPGEVMETLLQCNEYEVAQQWAEIFKVDQEFKQVPQTYCLMKNSLLFINKNIPTAITFNCFVMKNYCCE